jgi:hypothetical protein
LYDLVMVVTVVVGRQYTVKYLIHRLSPPNIIACLRS